MNNDAILTLALEEATSLKQAAKFRENADVLEKYAESIRAVINARAEITSLLAGEDQTMPLPLQPAGAGGKMDLEIFRSKRDKKISQHEACELALQRRGTPLSTEQILETIKELGIPITMPKQHSHLAPVMSRRGDIFANAGRGKWTLAKNSIAA